MNKFYIDEEAYNYLNEWTEKNKTKTIYAPYYFKKVQVILKGYERYIFFVEATGYGYKYTLHDGKISVLKGKMQRDPNEINDFSLLFEFVDIEYSEKYDQIMQVFCTAFMTANSFMWHGNIAEEKKYVVSGRTKETDKIYSFRKYKDSIYAVSVGHHKSPEGVFEVRGHFRQYKSGKVIWIDPYLKGTE